MQFAGEDQILSSAVHHKVSYNVLSLSLTFVFCNLFLQVILNTKEGPYALTLQEVGNGLTL